MPMQQWTLLLSGQCFEGIYMFDIAFEFKLTNECRLDILAQHSFQNWIMLGPLFHFEVF